MTAEGLVKVELWIRQLPNGEIERKSVEFKRGEKFRLEMPIKETGTYEFALLYFNEDGEERPANVKWDHPSPSWFMVGQSIMIEGRASPHPNFVMENCTFVTSSEQRIKDLEAEVEQLKKYEGAWKATYSGQANAHILVYEQRLEIEQLRLELKARDMTIDEKNKLIDSHFERAKKMETLMGDMHRSLEAGYVIEPGSAYARDITKALAHKGGRDEKP